MWIVNCPAGAKTLDMWDEHWQLVEDLLPVLQPVQIVTSLLSAETSPASSTVYPMIMKVRNDLNAVNITDMSAINVFKSDLRQALTDRFQLDDPATPVHPFVVASVLEPATRALENFSEQFKTVAYDHGLRYIDGLLVEGECVGGGGVRRPMPCQVALPTA